MTASIPECAVTCGGAETVSSGSISAVCGTIRSDRRLFLKGGLVEEITAFFVASLSMIGIPPTAGFVSKWYLAEGSVEAGDIAFLIVLLVSSVLNAAYFLPVSYTAFFETAAGGAVFSTGSIAWCGSLSHNRYDNNVARITGNVIRRFLDPAPFSG